ncbi:MAG TPA: ABC transporter permease [Acidobacteriaceae bacterium]|nr:ABC transporter permease [Acidobacteriaceae bacterium]
MSWRRFLGRKRRDVELQQEIILHIQEEIAENLERGLQPAEAKRRAYVKFGNPQRVREEAWQQSSIGAVENLIQDIRHAFRRLGKSPSTVFTVAISLGLGIAANVFIFTAVNRLLLEGPRVGDPATLLSLHSTTSHGHEYGKFTQRMFHDLQGQAKSFSDMAMYDVALPASIGGRSDPERVWGQSVTTNFFDVIARPMALGRGFLRNENREPVVVLSNKLWSRYFNGDAAIVGKTVVLSGQMFTVVGVAEPGFRGIDRLFDIQFWVPQGERDQLSSDRLKNLFGQIGEQLDVIARLRSGSERRQAQAELDAVAKRFAAAYPKEDEGLGFYITKAGELLPPQKAMFGTFLTALTAVALLVLCIASTNVANLLLVRAAAQHGEMAVRIALGATRFQLIRPMLLESTLLALGGGLCGVALCMVGIHGFAAFHLPSSVPIELTLHMDWRVLLCAFLLSVGTGMLCGIVPALFASRPVLPTSLKGETALDRPGRRWSLRGALVVVQIALSLVLLCATGLFLRSLKNSAGLDPGFRTRGLLMFSIDPVNGGSATEKTSTLLSNLRDRAVQVPGVISAAWTDRVPLSFYGWGSRFYKSGTKPSRDGEVPAQIYGVGAGFFDTMGIPWVAGQHFTTTDPNAPRQAVVNETFVQRVFGGGNAVGEHVTSDGKTYEIVGVVKNTKTRTIGEADEPILYRVLEQDLATAAPFMGFSLMVRYEGSPAEVASALQRETHAIDPTLAVYGQATMQEHLSDALIMPRVAAMVFGTFGLAGLLLASVGLYGVMSYTVSRRTREIGIRLALGATHDGVRRLVVRQGMVLAMVAVAIGLPLALAASKVLSGVLYGVTPHDWVTFTVAPCFLACVALIACWLPAQRAAGVEPQIALRHE